MMRVNKGGCRYLALFLLLACFSLQSGCSGSPSSDTSPGDGSVNLVAESVRIDNVFVASVPAPGFRERAIMDQGQNEYVGVDDWTAHDPLPVGTRLVNGGLYPAFSSDFSDRATLAYSNYFTTEAALQAATVGGVLDSALYNGLVQVGPWRASGTTGDFTYRRYGITYETVRPMPVAASTVFNNPQMNTAGAPGGASQFFAPFIRQDLIRLGYVKIVAALDSSASSRTSAIPRYAALAGRTTTAAELNQLALADYTAEMATRTFSQQELAARLRAESTLRRTEKKRGSSTFSAYAYSGDLTLGTAGRIDGYASVSLQAAGNIACSGTIWGMDRLMSMAGSQCSLAQGGLMEAWTDRLTPGDPAISMTCGTIRVEGRVQSQAASWTSWLQGVPGKISLATANADSTVPGITVSSQGQVLALLQTGQTDKALNAVWMTSPGSAIEIDGLGYGFNVVADKGTIHIENSGTTGTVKILDKAGLCADIVKAGAVGSRGTLIIHAGANLDANDLIKLFGGISGGMIQFKGPGDVILTSGSGAAPLVISADTVEVETGTRLVTKSWNGTARIDAAADVYCNQCNWSAPSGGDPVPGYEGLWTTPPNRAGPPPQNRAF